MTKLKKKIKMVLILTGSLALALFLTLVVHIAIMVKSHPPLVDATVQMARVDFHSTLTSLQETTLKQKVMIQNGARSVFYNPKTDILIYTFDNRLNSADAIFKKVIQPLFPTSTRVTVSEAEMASGCPAFDNHSFYGKLTAIISRIIQ